MSARAFVFQGEENFEAVKNAVARTQDAIAVREIEVKLTPKEFVNLFKRFHVFLTRQGLELEGREYRAT